MQDVVVLTLLILLVSSDQRVLNGLPPDDVEEHLEFLMFSCTRLEPMDIASVDFSISNSCDLEQMSYQLGSQVFVLLFLLVVCDEVHNSCFFRCQR